MIISCISLIYLFWNLNAGIPSRIVKHLIVTNNIYSREFALYAYKSSVLTVRIVVSHFFSTSSQSISPAPTAAVPQQSARWRAPGPGDAHRRLYARPRTDKPLPFCLYCGYEHQICGETLSSFTWALFIAVAFELLAFKTICARSFRSMRAHD